MRPKSKMSPWLLYPVLAVGAAILVVGLYDTARRVTFSGPYQRTFVGQVTGTTISPTGLLLWLLPEKRSQRDTPLKIDTSVGPWILVIRTPENRTLKVAVNRRVHREARPAMWVARPHGYSEAMLYDSEEEALRRFGASPSPSWAPK